MPRSEKLLESVEAEPKGLASKVRVRILEKARWYEIPDSDGDWMLD